MNTLHKTLTLAFMAAFIFLLGINVDVVGAQSEVTSSGASWRSRDPLLSRYLRFVRLTAEDVLSGDHTGNVVQDQRGLMWIATLSGLNRFDGTGVKLYRNDPDNPNSLSNNVARALVVDQNGILWVGTWGGGLNQFDRETDTFIHYQHDPDDSNSLSDNVIWSIFEDSAGILWVGTENGLNHFDSDSGAFVHYRNDPDEPISLSHNSVRAVFEDRSGNLWVGTGGGLDKLNPDRTRITRYQHDESDPQS